MDVDLLRPGTVPICPDRVLWFEFLIHKDLLKSHLDKDVPDPSPIELITKFYDAISDTLRYRMDIENPESLETVVPYNKQPAKTIALKILSLKVAAFIKWDLSQIRMLPFKTQLHLIKDVFHLTNSKTVEIPNLVLKKDIKNYTVPFLFATIIFHRWVLHTTMHRITSNWQLRHEENMICTPENIEVTVDFLTEALDWDPIPKMLTFDCFKLPSENKELEFDWSFCTPISRDEFSAQIHYDLAQLFFYKENYSLAREHFVKCLTHWKAITSHSGFVSLNPDALEVYVRACNGPSEGSRGSLLEQLNFAIVNQYMGITSILQQDNILQEIPLAHRLSLELNIQGALSSGTFTVARDLLFKIRALNIVRCVLDRKPANASSAKSLKKGEVLIWAIEQSWRSLSHAKKKLIKDYLVEALVRNDLPELLAALKTNETLSKMFDKPEMMFIEKSHVSLEIPASLSQTTWTIYDCRNRRKPKLEVKQLEQDLIATYDSKAIRELLVRISVNPLSTSVWSINPQWELPIPLQSVLKSLPRGFLHDFGFVMLAKAREQMLNRMWNSSLELMLILDKELSGGGGGGGGNVLKLSRLIGWEILLVQITQLLEEWPKTSIDKVAVANACEVCLQTSESVLPRTEIIEQCVICLLNLGRWEFLVNFDKRWASFEITAAVALACQELVKHKGNKKLSKNIWDIMLPIFANPPQQSKRGNQGNSSYHDTHVSNLRSSVVSLFGRVREATVFSVVISMLARLHNVLKDESNLEMQIEYALLWPAVVSNANSYNVKSVCELLTQILTQALHYHPTNISWLRLMGDVNFANGHYNVSLKNYLKSVLIYNDYFNIPVRPDDHIFRRMIKCCIALNCNTQAGVLCQFLEEPDYVLAFRILAEQKNCNDAVDAYYHCIWDTNILEYLIHVHNKRGEYQRRKCATQVIGLLELNSNNNEEIQREATNLRKSIFLRALCKQYVF